MVYDQDVVPLPGDLSFCARSIRTGCWPFAGSALVLIFLIYKDCHLYRLQEGVVFHDPRCQEMKDLKSSRRHILDAYNSISYH